MKTPRQILFERHRSAESRLDAVREAAIAKIFHADPPCREEEVFVSSTFFPSIRHTVLSLRWHLAGMSAVWLLALFLNIEHSTSSPVSVAKQNAPSPQQLVTALLENRRKIAELTATPANATEPAPVPQSFIPPRRSGFRSPTEMA